MANATCFVFVLSTHLIKLFYAEKKRLYTFAYVQSLWINYFISVEKTPTSASGEE